MAFDGNSVTTHPPHSTFQLEVSARGRIYFPEDFYLIGPAQEVTPFYDACLYRYDLSLCL